LKAGNIMIDSWR